MKWLKDLWAWLRSYPRPWRVVRITGNVTANGDCISVGPGVTLEILGDVTQTGSGCTIRFESASHGRVHGNLVSSLA